MTNKFKLILHSLVCILALLFFSISIWYIIYFIIRESHDSNYLENRVDAVGATVSRNINQKEAIIIQNSINDQIRITKLMTKVYWEGLVAAILGIIHCFFTYFVLKKNYITPKHIFHD